MYDRQGKWNDASKAPDSQAHVNHYQCNTLSAKSTSALAGAADPSVYGMERATEPVGHNHHVYGMWNTCFMTDVVQPPKDVQDMFFPTLRMELMSAIALPTFESSHGAMTETVSTVQCK
jgi:hypothetical protein